MSDVLPAFINDTLVPVNYQWHGYVKDSYEFKNCNFLRIEQNGKTYYVCSSENGVALGDYLSNYIIRDSCVWDLESVFSPGMDFWFYKAWEQAEPYYEEQPKWLHQLVNLLVSEGLLTRINRDSGEYLVFSDLESFEEQPLTSSIKAQVQIICRASLIDFCEEIFSDYGSTKELTEYDVSEWGAAIINEFVAAH